MLNEHASAANRLADLVVNEVPEKRSEEEYKAEIDAWERKFRAAWPAAIELFAAHSLSANEVTVVNKTRTFLHDVEMKLHLAGPVQAAELQA